jgi:hypothetical protein
MMSKHGTKGRYNSDPVGDKDYQCSLIAQQDRYPQAPTKKRAGQCPYHHNGWRRSTKSPFLICPGVFCPNNKTFIDIPSVIVAWKSADTLVA